MLSFPSASFFISQPPICLIICTGINIWGNLAWWSRNPGLTQKPQKVVIFLSFYEWTESKNLNSMFKFKGAKPKLKQWSLIHYPSIQLHVFFFIAYVNFQRYISQVPLSSFWQLENHSLEALSVPVLVLS